MINNKDDQARSRVQLDPIRRPQEAKSLSRLWVSGITAVQGQGPLVGPVGCLREHQPLLLPSKNLHLKSTLFSISTWQCQKEWFPQVSQLPPLWLCRLHKNRFPQRTLCPVLQSSGLTPEQWFPRQPQIGLAKALFLSKAALPCEASGGVWRN